MLGEGVGVGDDTQAVQRGCRQYVSPAAALACGAAWLPFSPIIPTGDDHVHRRQTSHTALMPHGNQHAATRGEAFTCCVNVNIQNAATSSQEAVVHRVRAYRVWDRVARNVGADCTCS